MDPTQQDQPPKTDQDGPKKRGRKRRFTIGVWMVLTNFFLLVFAVYASLSLTERALPAPQWVTDRFEGEVNDALTQGRISVGKMALSVSSRGLPSMEMVNLGIFDQRGSEIARLNRVGVRFAASGLVRGQARPRHLELSGAQITMRRSVNGEFDLSLGENAAASGDLTTILDAVDQFFQSEFMNGVEDVVANDLTIAVEDARSGRLWQITEGNLRIERTEHHLDYAISFDVFNGTEDLAETELNIQTELATSQAVLAARFVNASSKDIAVQSPTLAFLGVLDAPINGALRSGFDAAGELSEFNATLEIGQGALRPTQNAVPVGFDRAKAYFSFDPNDQKLTFTEISVDSPSLTLRGEGHAYLRDLEGRWPQTLLAQVQLSELAVNPEATLAEPFVFVGGAADLRVSLAPFVIDFGQISLATDQEQLVARAKLQSRQDGWNASADLKLDQIGVDRLLALWPNDVAANTREWFQTNVTSGTIKGLNLAVRNDALSPTPRFELGFGFGQANIRVVPDFPLLREAQGYGVLQDTAMTFVVESGHMQSPTEGRVDVSGTSFQVPDTSQRPSQAQISLRASGQAKDVIGIVALPPINALAGSTLAADFASGDVALWGDISYPMVREKPKGSFRFDVSARISNAASDVVLPGKIVTAPEIDVVVTNDGVTVGGPMRVGQVAGNLTWAKAFGDGAVSNSRLSGFIELSKDLVEEFSLGLPDDMFDGQSSGQLEMVLRTGVAPEFELTSSLEGLGMALPPVGWRKPASEAGRLFVSGRLGEVAAVDDIKLSTSGMKIQAGTISLNEDGSFADARMDGVRIGDWFEGPVALTSRGAGAVPRISVLGGNLDLRRAEFGSGGGGNGGPIEVALDDVLISSGIRLTNVQGELDSQGGISGRFSARVNGGAGISGQLESVADGVAARIVSSNGGRVLSDAGIFTSASGGRLDMTLQPRGQGVAGYNGSMVITDVNVKRAPALTELLSAVSIVGLLDQMRGAGIVFSRVEALFDIDDNRARIRRSSAVGPSLGVSLDGTYEFANARLTMQGVVSPVYFLNAIGQAISPRRGEGLFGFNFKLTGAASKPKVTVNPLSILTPGGFRDIFRAQPPKDTN